MSLKLNKFILNKEQEDKILEAWNVKKMDSLQDIVNFVFPGEGLDGRSLQGRAVKEFLAGRQLKALNVKDARKNGPYVLAESQKEFIANNANAYDSWLDLAKEMFQNPQLTPLYAEAKAVKEYYDALDPKLKVSAKEDISTDVYNPPRSDDQAISRINRYCFDGIDRNKLTPKQKECIKKLQKFMNTYRFVSEMNCLHKVEERKAFESTFVRLTWDKPDLTEEEVELYINYCCDIVAAYRMKREEEVLLLEIENARSNSQNGQAPTSLIDQLGGLREDKDRCSSRQKKTLEDLNGKRSVRLKDQGGGNITVLTLIDAFREKIKKDQIAKIGRARAQEVKEEVKRLETMEDLKVEIFGIDPSEIFL